MKRTTRRRQAEPNRGSGPSGFTLVELLVVIGIIGALVSILLPSLGRARAIAKQTKCLSQMVQIGDALQMYLGENRGVFPIQVIPANGIYQGVPNFADDGAAPSFLGLLIPYFTDVRVLVCPVADFTGYYATQQIAPTATSDTNYIGNAVLCGRPVTQVPRGGADIVCVQEDIFDYNSCFCRPYASGPSFAQWHISSIIGQDLCNIHSKGGNLLFVDGHAEYRLLGDLRASDFGLGASTTNPAFTGQATDNYMASDTFVYNAAF